MDPTTLHVRRAKDGDHASLGWLVARFTPWLLAQARYRLRSGGLGVEPEDVVQDVWAAALPALPGLAPREGRETPVLLKFLATTLVYRVNELLRQRIRQRLEPGAGDGAVRALPDAASRGALTRAAQGDDYRRILAAIDTLPEADREVVVLRAVEQHDNAAVARLLGQTPNAVSLRFRRAMARLRERLSGTSFDLLDADSRDS